MYNVVMSMIITSRAFNDQAPIPPQYTCDGEGVNPPLLIENIPADTISLTLIMEDPDSISGTWDHWVKFNIPVESDTFYIEEADEPEGVSGKGTAGDMEYFGPCPQKGTHRYIFRVFALNAPLKLEQGASKDEVIEAMEGKIIEEAEVTGLYTKEHVH